MIYVTLLIIILLIVHFIYKNGKLLLLKYEKEYLNELIKNDKSIMDEYNFGYDPFTTFSSDKNILWTNKSNNNSKTTIIISKNEN